MEAFMRNYLQRTIEQRLKEAFTQEKIVLLLGARQVGKSTILKNLFSELKYFVLDPIFDEYNLKLQADLFLKSFTGPLILDEIQFYPELLGALKRFVDQQESNGQYLLTGSQNFSMLKTISESMAGRVAILELHPMTFLERYAVLGTFWVDLLLENKNLVGNISAFDLPDNIYEILWRGQLPGRIDKKDSYNNTFFASYVN